MPAALIVCAAWMIGNGVDSGAKSESDPATIFVQANTAYGEGRFDVAADSYQALLERGFEGGLIWYNLGNCRLRQGDLGGAIAAYLMAQALRPRDEDIRANLAFARKMAKDEIPPEQSAAVLRTLFFWHFALNRKELLISTVVASLLFWIVLGVRLFKREWEGLRWAAAILLVLTLALATSFAARWLMPRQVAVVTAEEVNVHSGTNADTVVRFKLHAGTEVRSVDLSDGWVRIALPDGKQGWVPEAEVQTLVL